MKIRHVRSHFDNLSRELVPYDQWDLNRGLRPFIPIVNVQVGAANSGAQNANLHVVDARLGLRHVRQPKARSSAAFHEGFHSDFLFHAKRPAHFDTPLNSCATLFIFSFFRWITGGFV
jgi:hypothetical protein